MAREAFTALALGFIPVIAAIAIGAIAGVVHHRWVSGGWWDWDQVVHHETIILALIAWGLGMVVARIRRDPWWFLVGLVWGVALTIAIGWGLLAHY